MPVNTGKYRHRVRIEKLDYVRDSQGEAIQDPNTGEVLREWVEVATVWAAIEPLSAKEFLQSAATQARADVRIVIRQRDDVDASMRLVHVRLNRPDVIYNPHGFLADKESGLEYMTAPCSRGVGEGQ